MAQKSEIKLGVHGMILLEFESLPTSEEEALLCHASFGAY